MQEYGGPFDPETLECAAFCVPFLAMVFLAEEKGGKAGTDMEEISHEGWCGRYYKTYSSLSLTCRWIGERRCVWRRCVATFLQAVLYQTPDIYFHRLSVYVSCPPRHLKERDLTRPAIIIFPFTSYTPT